MDIRPEKSVRAFDRPAALQERIFTKVFEVAETSHTDDCPENLYGKISGGLSRLR